MLTIFRSIAVAAALLSVPPGLAAEQAETKWIFPGQSLPEGVPYVPLRSGSSGGVDVQVPARDWFLLKRSSLLARDYVGPALGETNAQIYFRFVSGMILQETLEQMGMKRAQARF